MPDETVLVVDDSPTIVKLVQLVLTKARYRVTTASTGDEGLRLAKQDRPHLVLLASVIRGMAAENVCRALADHPELAAVPVVVMTPRSPLAGRAFEPLSNVADQITKPFSPSALVAVIGHALEKGRTVGGKNEPLGDAPDSQPASAATNPQGRSSPGQVALSGDLAIISIADVLALLHDQRQTGVLTVVNGDATLEVFFRDGLIDFAAARGLPQEISRALTRQPDARNATSIQVSALVYECLRWDGGQFSFQASTQLPPAAQATALGIPAATLIMEGLRRIDEWRLMERELGEFDNVFVRDESRLTAFGRGNLLREELAVIELVNGKNSLKDIVYITKLGSFEVAKMLFRLSRNKLIRRRLAPIAV